MAQAGVKAAVVGAGVVTALGGLVWGLLTTPERTERVEPVDTVVPEFDSGTILSPRTHEPWEVPVWSAEGAPTLSQAFDRVAHPGWDIVVPAGSTLAAVDHAVVLEAGPVRFRCPGRGVVDDRALVLSTVKYRIRYLHVGELSVHEGDTVMAGEIVGQSDGRTGCSTGPHLHLEITRRTGAIDPGTLRWRRPLREWRIGP